MSAAGRPELVVVAAVAENRVIGRDGDLAWRLPADLARFKRLTVGGAVVMGRRTFESIGRPLPDRRNVVLTRDADWRAPGAEAASSLDGALEALRDEPVVFVIGGGAVYAEAIPRADRLELTAVHASVPGDTLFPDWDPGVWRLVGEERREADERHEHAFSFRTYARA